MFTNIVWASAAILFLIIEGATAGLTSIWFVIGAAVALLCSLLGLPLWTQILAFIVVSVATLVLTRPLAVKYVNSKRQPTNADRSIGETGRVMETIDNLAATGTVSLGGKIWTARSSDGSLIPQGELVRAVRIEGVKLIVEPVLEKETEKI